MVRSAPRTRASHVSAAGCNSTPVSRRLRATLASDAPCRTSKSNGLRGSGNGSRYSNPDLDKILADAIATGDDAARADLYQQAQVILFDDAVALPAFHKRLVLASTANVDMDNVHTNAEGYPNFYDVGFLS